MLGQYQLGAVYAPLSWFANIDKAHRGKTRKDMRWNCVFGSHFLFLFLFMSYVETTVNVITTGCVLIYYQTAECNSSSTKHVKK